MAANIFHMDHANLFVGDDDPTDSQFLTLKSIKLPSLNEKTKDHMGAGASMGIQLGMRMIDPLELTFKLEGFNPTVMPRFMPAGGARINYTVRGNVRDLLNSTDIAVKAVINGRMVKTDVSEFSRDGGIESDYQITEVVRYQFWLDNVEKYYFNFFDGPAGIRIDGAQPYRAVARNLGLV